MNDMTVDRRVEQIEAMTAADHRRRAARLYATSASKPEQQLLLVLVELTFALIKEDDRGGGRG